MVRYPKTAWQAGVDRQSTTAQRRVPGAARATAGVTVHDAVIDFIAAAEDGSALDRYGHPFSAEAVSELTWCLSGHVDRRLGGMDLGEVQRHDLEALVDDLAAGGLSPRRLRAVAKSVRALYDYADERGLVASNPAERMVVPAEDDAEQPSRDRPQAGRFRSVVTGAESAVAGADRAIALGLQVLTVLFVLLALVLIAESL